MLTYEVGSRHGRPADPLRRAHLHAVHLGHGGHRRPRPSARRSRTPGSPPSATSASCCGGASTSRRSPGSRPPTRRSHRDRGRARMAWCRSGSADRRSACRAPQFKPHFDQARAAGLHSVPHAGETTGPETIWDSIRDLGAERIGHGTSATQDPSCSPISSSTASPLEVCPTSNVATRVVRDARRAPDPRDGRGRRRGHGQLRRPADVRRPRSTSEYAVAAELLGLDESGLAELARTAVRRELRRRRREARVPAPRSTPTLAEAESASVATAALAQLGVLGSRPDRPFHARLTRCAATIFLAGLRASSHHWPVVPTMPTSICAYIGAYFASKPRLLNSASRMYSTRDAMSPMIETNEPDSEPIGESRTRMRKPSDDSSM